MKYTIALEKNYKIILLSLIIALLNCPTYLLIYAPTIDCSLCWVFNYFADDNYGLGKHIIFPHGPLAFLIYPITLGNNLFVASFVHVFCSFGLSLSWYNIQKNTATLRLSITTLLIFVFLAFADIQLLLIALAASILWLYDRNKEWLYLALTVACCVFNLYIKSYGGAICTLLLLSYTIQQSIASKKFTLAAKLICLYLLFFITTWLLLYGTLEGSLTFLYGQLQLLSDNSEAVQYNTTHNWWLLTGFLVGVFAFFVFIPFKQKNRFLLLFLLPLFAAWKHAMARSEETHLTGLLCFLILLILFMCIISEPIYWHGLICLGSSTLFFLFNVQYTDDRTMAYRLGAFVRANNYYNYTLHHDSLSKLTKSQCDYYCRNLYLSDSVLNFMGRNKVDVYPNNYAILAINKLNWQPRPLINSYAAYTPWLDEQNARHWDSEKAPAYVIWETEDVDGRGSELESIDNRYLLNDEPKAIIRFFANYELKIKKNNFMIYSKRKQPLNVTSTMSAKKNTKLNEWLEIPACDSNEVLRARVSIQKTALNHLKSFLYKGDIFYLHYMFDNGSTFYHRIVPKNAEEGIWLNPLVLHPQKKQVEKRVKRIRLECLSPYRIASGCELQFEKIRFEEFNTSGLFNKGAE